MPSAMAAHAALAMEGASACSMRGTRSRRGFGASGLPTVPPPAALQRTRVLSVRAGREAFPDLPLQISSKAFFGCDLLCELRDLRFSPLDQLSKRQLHVRASAADESSVAGEGLASGKSEVIEKAASDTGGSNLVQTLQLGSLFGLWYLFNIYFNICNKQVLKAFPFPVNITQFQFAIGSVLVLLMWGSGVQKRPVLTKAQVLSILPLAVVHTLGNLFTNMSLGRVAVSFTHTIKAMEPFFSVILSAIFLGEVPSPWVVASLVPIVGGVALASITEASFNWVGFFSAMASNLTFQSRNVLSKKFMVKKEGSLDNINLFSIITILSFFLLAPATFLIEGFKFNPTYLQSSGLNVKVVGTQALLAGLCFHAYQQVSYMILQRVTPVTHSVGNCVKRVIVIVTSVLFFKIPVSQLNGFGTGLALAGVFAYSRAKNVKSATKKGV